MARYQISDSDIPFAKEFLEDPIGYHSPGLQRVLNRMRGADWTFKYVLIVDERYRRWKLGKMPAHRGAKIEIVEGVEYVDLIEAERDIFRRRWADLTGNSLNGHLS